MYITQTEIKPITAKKYMLDNWNQYDLVDTKEEFLALINILQACGENIDSLHDVCFQGYDEFCDILGKWENDRDVVKSLYKFAGFFTEEEFIDYIMERWQEANDDGEDGTEYIRCITSDDPEDFSDTQITKTEDGYVVRVWY